MCNMHLYSKNSYLKLVLFIWLNRRQVKDGY